MTLFQTQEARGVNTTPGPLTSGVVVVISSEFVLPRGLAAGDVVEMLRLPAYCTVVDATMVADQVDPAIGEQIQLEVGLMTGEPGSPDPSRSCGKEFFTPSFLGLAGGVTRMYLPSGFRIGKVDALRAIGMRFVALPAADLAGVRVKLLVSITQ